MPIVITGNDANQNPPDPITDAPAAKPKIGGRAADTNDGGALWCDHDDPGLAGAPGEDGYPGIPGQAGEFVRVSRGPGDGTDARDRRRFQAAGKAGTSPNRRGICGL